MPKKTNPPEYGIAVVVNPLMQRHHILKFFATADMLVFFLIPTRGTGVHPKNKIRPCVCSTNLGFSVTSANGIRPNHGIPLPAYIHIVFENAHTHIATAASETEGVAAVSWIESWIESCV